MDEYNEYDEKSDSSNNNKSSIWRTLDKFLPYYLFFFITFLAIVLIVILTESNELYKYQRFLLNFKTKF